MTNKNVNFFEVITKCVFVK